MVEFSFAFFELSYPDQFCEEICWLFLRGDKLHSDSVVPYFFTSEMVINFKVFDFCGKQCCS